MKIPSLASRVTNQTPISSLSRWRPRMELLLSRGWTLSSLSSHLCDRSFGREPSSWFAKSCLLLYFLMVWRLRGRKRERENAPVTGDIQKQRGRQDRERSRDRERKRETERERISLVSLPLRALIPFTRAPPHNLMTSRRPRLQTLSCYP